MLFDIVKVVGSKPERPRPAPAILRPYQIAHASDDGQVRP
jgi:hypothetical protein